MIKLKNIDINADLGEGAGFDADLMPLISSCSIACGGHFGDEESMRSTIQLAKKHGVKVGAHPSFPDIENFGRKVLSMSKSDLKNSIEGQLQTFYEVCEAELVPVNHIKLHGALYNYAAIDTQTADAIVEAVTVTKLRPKLYVQHGSILHEKSENVLPLVFEAFIDRSYNDDLSLVSRNSPNALIDEPDHAWKQLFNMISRGVVKTTLFEEKPIVAATYCIHGDHPHSVAIMKYIHEQLNIHSISLS